MSSDAELLKRINELSGAIEQYRMSQSNSRGAYRGRGFARGAMTWARGRGRGRGGSYNLTLNSTAPAKPRSHNLTLNNSNNDNTATAPSRSHNLTLNNTVTTPKYSPQLTSAPISSPTIPKPASPLARPSPHRKLINNATVPIVQSTSLSGERRVTIDGVNFIVKGRKLIRQDRLSNKLLPPTIKPGSLIRLRRTSKRKQPAKPTLGLRRSKQGNMVYVPAPQSEGYVRQGKAGKTLVLKDKQQKTKTYCGIYTRYGKCKKGTRCPFIHDPSHRAICPWFLKNECKKPPGQCRLSHEPTPEIMPHCSYFQRGMCTRESCMFMHVHVRPDAPVCRAFAVEGYCSKGLACKNKHIHVCPEFAATGKCSNANCLMPHVARRTKEQSGVAGVASLRSWVSAKCLHEQKAQHRSKNAVMTEGKHEQQQQQQQPGKQAADETPVQSRQEAEEEQGFLRLFDDDDDEGWSQYQIKDDDAQELRLSEEQEEDNDDDYEEEEEEEEYDENSGESMDEDDYEEYEIADQ